MLRFFIVVLDLHVGVQVREIARGERISAHASTQRDFLLGFLLDLEEQLAAPS